MIWSVSLEDAIKMTRSQAQSVLSQMSRDEWCDGPEDVIAALEANNNEL